MMSKSEKLDDILKTCLEYPTNLYDVSDFTKGSKNKRHDSDIIMSLFEKIDNEGIANVDFKFKTIQSNGYTKNFLENGGFIKKETLENERIKLEQTNQKLKDSKLKTDYELSKLKLQDYKTTRVLARIGFGISILLAVLKIISWIND